MFPPPRLLFDGDHAVYAFESLSHAQHAIAAHDLLYDVKGTFTATGGVVDVSVDSRGRLVILDTGTTDQPRLQQLLEASAARRGADWPTHDPRAVTSLLLEEQPWPRRPRWLARLVRGSDHR
ncbi:hypothetical protein [Aquipuribacter nitratireducens]|uniref:Metallo-beta-lactamase domain-containing protein n=1 Tax=Aquipuribacter nitratireducens TaxID=650104 RepID=A0ABW0GR93_9MICO